MGADFAIIIESFHTGPDSLGLQCHRWSDEFGRNRVCLNQELEKTLGSLGIAALKSYQLSDGEWATARAGLRTVRVALQLLQTRNPDLSEHIESLLLLEQILIQADHENRRWRLKVMW